MTGLCTADVVDRKSPMVETFRRLLHRLRQAAAPERVVDSRRLNDGIALRPLPTERF